MTYRLEFLPSARKEWDKLGTTLREQFKKKLAERLTRPRVQADALRGMPDHYKIKLLPPATGWFIASRMSGSRSSSSPLASVSVQRSTRQRKNAEPRGKALAETGRAFRLLGLCRLPDPQNLDLALFEGFSPARSRPVVARLAGDVSLRSNQGKLTFGLRFDKARVDRSRK